MVGARSTLPVGNESLNPDLKCGPAAINVAFFVSIKNPNLFELQMTGFTYNASIGGKVDILVNTAEYHRVNTISSRQGVDAARAERIVSRSQVRALSHRVSAATSARA